MSALPVTPPTTPDTAIPDADIAADRSPAAGSHPAHTAYPDALRERAVARYCEGLRSPAIAAQLGVSERTIRAWLADARRTFAQHAAADGDGDGDGNADADADADTAAVSVHQRLALAVERQLAIAAAAWQSYHHAVLLDQLALDHHRVVAEQAANRRTLTGEVPPPPVPPRPSTACARFLSVALAAQREAARLQGCYGHPTMYPPTPRATPHGMHPTSPAMCPAASASLPQSPFPAKTATATSPSPAVPASPIPATPAAAPDRQPRCAVTLPSKSSPPSVSSVVNPRIPATPAAASPSSPPLFSPRLPLPPRESPSPHVIHAAPPPHSWQRIL